MIRRSHITVITPLFICIGILGAAYAQNTTDNTLTTGLRESAALALFQDQLPWGSNRIQLLLTQHQIPFDVFPSARMGDPDLDLSNYGKVIIVSQQPAAFYQRLAANRDWFEAYVVNGGTLQLHLADRFSEVERIPLPGGIRLGPLQPSERVEIFNPEHTLLTFPQVVPPEALQGWQPSTYGAILDVPEPADVVTASVEPEYAPATVVFPWGDGLILATRQPVEWLGASMSFLDNLIMFVAGASTAVECNDTASAPGGAGKHCVSIVTRNCPAKVLCDDTEIEGVPANKAAVRCCTNASDIFLFCNNTSNPQACKWAHR